MRLDAVLKLEFRHVLTGLNDQPVPCGSTTQISGYTEWTTNDLTDLSVGWDWIARSMNGLAEWSRDGLPRSNLLLVDGSGRPYPLAKSDVVLGTVVDALRWQESASRWILR